MNSRKAIPRDTKENLVQSTIALGKLPKKSLVQSKLAFQIVMTIHTKKKQPAIDDEIEDMYDTIPKHVRDTGKKTYTLLLGFFSDLTNPSLT